MPHSDDFEETLRLTEIATALLDDLEHAQLRALTLARRELTDLANSDLAVVYGRLELLLDRLQLSPDLASLALESRTRLAAAAEKIRRLEPVQTIVVRHSPTESPLDLDRSVGISARNS
jgi:hypothetical protein